MLTDDPTDARLGRGPGGVGMNEAYLVLPDEERVSEKFVRPVRLSYVHWYMLDGSPLPRVVTSLQGIIGGCGAVTTMSLQIAETYARDPGFYGATYCTGCQTHLPVREFTWDGTDEPVGS